MLAALWYELNVRLVSSHRSATLIHSLRYCPWVTVTVLCKGFLRGMHSDADIFREPMNPTIIVIDRDHTPITLNTERPTALLLSPVVVVAVCHLLIDGTLIDTTSR